VPSDWKAEYEAEVVLDNLFRAECLRLEADKKRLGDAWRILSQGGCVITYYPTEFNAVKVLDAAIYLTEKTTNAE